MSDEEKKKNGEYEKPESHDVERDELEEVSGGAEAMPGASGCSTGERASVRCKFGQYAGYACCDGGAGDQRPC